MFGKMSFSFFRTRPIDIKSWPDWCKMCVVLFVNTVGLEHKCCLRLDVTDFWVGGMELMVHLCLNFAKTSHLPASPRCDGISLSIPLSLLLYCVYVAY